MYSAIDTLLLAALSLECLRTLQSYSYRPERGFYRVFITPYYLTLVAVQVAAALFYAYGFPEYAVTIAYFVAACPWLFVKRKCTLKFTKRIARLIVAEAVVLFVLCYFVGNAFFAAALPAMPLSRVII